MRQKQINLLFNMEEYAKDKYLDLLKTDNVDKQFELFNELDIIFKVFKIEEI